jgi:hypothetical protein
MIHKDYIIEVLARFEGKAITKGYVPCKNGVPLGASGVTIGTGFDLGQQNRGSIKALGLSEELQEKLAPYLGLKKEAALEILARKPLLLSQAEIKDMDEAVHEKYITETADMFGPVFEEAPKQVQAAAVSLHYQFGTPRRAASPGLGLAWDAMWAGRYGEAAAYLTNPKGWSSSHQQYLPRRRQEAALLREIQ